MGWFCEGVSCEGVTSEDGGLGTGGVICGESVKKTKRSESSLEGRGVATVREVVVVVVVRDDG